MEIATGSWGIALVWYAVFVMSVTAHEAAHAWAALRGGDPTAYLGGQVSLDPQPHIRRSPIGMLVMPILSILYMGWPIGFASAPYDPGWAYEHPRRAGWMSLAGPAANLALMAAAGIVIVLCQAAGLFTASARPSFQQIVHAVPGGMWPGFANAISITFAMNLILFLFNMLPIPPLDGSGALSLLVSDERARRLQRMLAHPSLSLIGLLVAWNYFGPIARHAFVLSLNILFPGAGYALR